MYFAIPSGATLEADWPGATDASIRGDLARMNRGGPGRPWADRCMDRSAAHKARAVNAALPARGRMPRSTIAAADSGTGLAAPSLGAFEEMTCA